MSVKWDNLQEFEQYLQALPDRLVAGSEPIVDSTARQVARDTASDYPRRTGTLINRIEVKRESKGKGITTARVRSMAPHSHFIERGTKPRRSRYGNRGSMPKPTGNEAMVPKVVRARKKMVDQLIDLLENEGFDVSALFTRL